MLSKKDAPLAEPIADRLLGEKLKAYDITPKDTTFSYTENFASNVYTYDADNEANNWKQHINIDTQELSGVDGKYCPISVVKAHELGHIMQTLPGTKENDFNATVLAELAPTIELIAMQDEVYKEIHNIPLNEEVIYPTSSDPPLPNLGKIANTFRSIKQRHNLRSYEDVLLTKEASIAINKFTQNIDVPQIIDNIYQDKMIDEFIRESISSSETTKKHKIDATQHSSHKETPSPHNTISKRIIINKKSNNR
jgi:hypothetical protein